MNLVKYLENSIKKNSKDIAILNLDQEISYEDLWNKVSEISKLLVQMGIKRGDRVGICLSDYLEYLYIFFAVLKINAIAIPIKYQTRIYEFKQIIKNSKPIIIITNESFIKKFFLKGFSSVYPNIVVVSKRLQKQQKLGRYIELTDLLGLSSKFQLKIKTEGDCSASIHYTYRGVGYPLGVPHSHDNYINGIKMYLNEVKLQNNDSILMSSDPTYIYPFVGNVLVPLFVGARIVILQELNLYKIVEYIQKLRITYIANVPTFYSMLLKVVKEKNIQFDTLKKVIVGGDFLTAELYKNIKEILGKEVYQGYGLTETLPITCNDLKTKKYFSVGKVHEKARIQIKIVDAHGKKVKANCKGEILVRGKTVMKGYYKKGNFFIKNGWFYTGDIGYMDEEGYVFLVERKKKIIKIGGKMVDLMEVENVIRKFKNIRDVNLEIIKDKMWGSLLYAYLVPNIKDNFSVLELKRCLRSELSSYKIPRIIIKK